MAHQHEWKQVGMLTAGCWCGAARLVGERLPTPPSLSPAAQQQITERWRAYYAQLIDDLCED